MSIVKHPLRAKCTWVGAEWKQSALQHVLIITCNSTIRDDKIWQYTTSAIIWKAVKKLATHFTWRSIKCSLRNSELSFFSLWNVAYITYSLWNWRKTESRVWKTNTSLKLGWESDAPLNVFEWNWLGFVFQFSVNFFTSWEIVLCGFTHWYLQIILNC